MTDLVDVHLIAERLDVPVNNVRKWRQRDILPAVDYPQLRSPVWNWGTIRTWAESTGRLEPVDNA